MAGALGLMCIEAQLFFLSFSNLNFNFSWSFFFGAISLFCFAIIVVLSNNNNDDDDSLLGIVCHGNGDAAVPWTATMYHIGRYNNIWQSMPARLPNVSQNGLHMR